MQTGSLVQLKEPFTNPDLEVISRNGIKKWPVVDEIYEVNYLRKPIYDHNRFITCIVLIEFPDFEAAKIDMDAEAFNEVMPPTPNLERIINLIPEEVEAELLT